MAYFIFNNAENVDGTLYKIAENKFYLDNLLFNKNPYKIIESSNEEYLSFIKGRKFVVKFVGNEIIFKEAGDGNPKFETRSSLIEYINSLKKDIQNFLINTTHPLYSIWNNYFNYLSTLNADEIIPDINEIENGITIKKEKPLLISLEEYILNQGEKAYHPIELP